MYNVIKWLYYLARRTYELCECCMNQESENVQTLGKEKKRNGDEDWFVES